MGVYKAKKPTKDGRIWFYKTSIEDVFGNKKPIVSKKFATKTEAQRAERELLSQVDNGYKASDMTFAELYEKFREFQDTRIKKTTKRNYDRKLPYLEMFMNIKCVDYSIEQYEVWRNKINQNPNLCTTTKNDLYKFWKSILNYGMKWYNFDFNSVYKKMINFTNPNEIKKEMDFYTYDEFSRFISHEEDLRYKVFFETLYYCGLRRGEARGLTWDNINFKNKTLSVTKQVISEKGESGAYYFSSPKTRDSYRTIPMCDALYNDLKAYYSIVSKPRNFNQKFFVFGSSGGLIPISPHSARIRKKKLAELAGLKEIRLHDFRHSCASLLINSGANVTIVAKFLGHTKIEETLNTYTHMYQSAMGDVMKIMNSLE